MMVLFQKTALWWFLFLKKTSIKSASCIDYKLKIDR